MEFSHLSKKESKDLLKAEKEMLETAEASQQARWKYNRAIMESNDAYDEWAEKLDGLFTDIHAEGFIEMPRHELLYLFTCLSDSLSDSDDHFRNVARLFKEAGKLFFPDGEIIRLLPVDSEGPMSLTIARPRFTSGLGRRSDWTPAEFKKAYNYWQVNGVAEIHLTPVGIESSSANLILRIRETNIDYSTKLIYKGKTLDASDSLRLGLESAREHHSGMNLSYLEY